ncbi:MAG TPA: CotH kinase family protein, partial [Paludibacteraceae bacterium]|nr:CotH kinase family protein [Paludibacteraceae bacterium]
TDNAKIYYTKDGSDPVESSTLYNGSISINSSTVIRARAYSDGRICSEITTGSYIFLDSYHSECGGGFTVPIISISTNNDNFFSDQTGIYVKGTNGVTGESFCDSQNEPANYFQDWKRPVNVEYIVDGKQVVSQEMEAGIMGGCSRGYALKSLKVSASNKTGYSSIYTVGSNDFYNFFPNKKGTEYKSIQIRNGGNDYDYSRIRDGFMQSLTEGKMDIDHQAYQPVAYFINGKYYGQMDLRERTNKDYIYTNYGLEDDEIDLLEISKGKVEATEVSSNAFDTLMAKSDNYDAENYYEEMNRLMDMNEYMDYQIFEQYIVNTDWPSNNTKVWRSIYNGRFRWIVYDTDFGFGLYGDGGNNHTSVNTNMLLFAMGEGDRFNWGNGTETSSGFTAPVDGDIWKVKLFRNLMKNKEFKEKFLNKFLIHLGTTFNSDRVNSIMDSIYSNAEAEICAHWKKNNQYNNSYSDQKDGMASFATNRTDVVYANLKEYYGLGKTVNLSISSNINNADFILNGIRVNDASFEGKYFAGMNLNIVPVAPTGYVFKSWNITSETTSSLLDGNSQWKYYYKGDMPSNSWFETSYDDAAWEKGQGRMGYGKDNSLYNTILDYGDDSSNKYITGYFRTTFEIDDPSNWDNIKANMVYDDGVIIYINGKEACRYNMPDNEVDYETVASDYKNDEEVSFTLDKSLFVKGTNVIAIELHQNVATSSDFTLEFNLSGVNKNSSDAIQAYDKEVTDDVALVATFVQASYIKPTIVINEICASSNMNSKNADEFGNYPDWIELYNYGTKDVDLAGLYISDNAEELDKYQFPTTDEASTIIKAGEHKIIWADDYFLQGVLHTNFKLSATEASKISLSVKLEQGLSIIDSITYQLHAVNESYGREKDADDTWTTFGIISACNLISATPGSQNGTKNCNGSGGYTDNTELAKNETNEEYALYPNPAKNNVNISVPNSGKYEIAIYDVQGDLKQALDYQSSGTISLDVSKYESGFYLLNITSEFGIANLNFIIVK